MLGVRMESWTPQEITDHIQYMNDFAARLEDTGEFVDGQALAPEGAWVRYDGEGRPPVTDGPFAETKDLIAGWMIIDVDGWDRAVERKKTIINKKKKLNGLRQQYAGANQQGKAKMAPAILDLEKRILQMSEELDALEVNVRNAEKTK